MKFKLGLKVPKPVELKPPKKQKIEFKEKDPLKSKPLYNGYEVPPSNEH